MCERAAYHTITCCARGADAEAARAQPRRARRAGGGGRPHDLTALTHATCACILLPRPSQPCSPGWHALHARRRCLVRARHRRRRPRTRSWTTRLVRVLPALASLARASSRRLLPRRPRRASRPRPLSLPRLRRRGGGWRRRRRPARGHGPGGERFQDGRHLQALPHAQPHGGGAGRHQRRAGQPVGRRLALVSARRPRVGASRARPVVAGARVAHPVCVLLSLRPRARQAHVRHGQGQRLAGRPGRHPLHVPRGAARRVRAGAL